LQRLIEFLRHISGLCLIFGALVALEWVAKSGLIGSNGAVSGLGRVFFVLGFQAFSRSTLSILSCMSPFQHGYSFDPSYGYNLGSLLAVAPPLEPLDFAEFWTSRYERVFQLDPQPVLSGSQAFQRGFELSDIAYESTEGFRIGGWLLTPTAKPIRRALLVGHGYGGRDGPDVDLPLDDAAYLFLCFRGLSRSRRHDVSDNPAFHVLHDIDKPHRYLMGGCVEDLWTGVSVLERLFPQVRGHVGYQGTSFGGGIGAMAMAWDLRIRRGALNVPTFGHQALRLGLPTIGSGDAVSRFERHRGHVMETLQYYDAALAAQHIRVPVHVAAALFDPAVAPPGQFAIFNALTSPKELFVLEAGHFDFQGRAEQDRRLFIDLQRFFEPL